MTSDLEQAFAAVQSSAADQMRLKEVLREGDDERSNYAREALISAPDEPERGVWELPDDVAGEITGLVDRLFLMAHEGPTGAAELTREYLTTLALDMSLCPVHFRDYAICFDDEDDECAQVRMVHPLHDT